MDFFPGFTETQLGLKLGRVRLRHGGSGPPLLMLHGMPQTHVMWHKVAPILAETHTVICPDLTGYGGSFKPPATADHAPYAKRAMARDMADVMAALGHQRFSLVGHDRGARVAHRLVLDHPRKVERVALLDIIPTIEHFERTDMRFAMGYYHWFFLAQAHPFPEDLINLDAGRWLLAQAMRHAAANSLFAEPALGDYLKAVRDPATVTAMCEDYRAAATIDLVHDRASRAQGDKITCSTLVLWGSKGLVSQLYDPLEVWRGYCAGPLDGHAIVSSHYLAEEAPEATLAALIPFLSKPG
jgi:haloacetate dehalogenase